MAGRCRVVSSQGMGGGEIKKKMCSLRQMNLKYNKTKLHVGWHYGGGQVWDDLCHCVLINNMAKNRDIVRIWELSLRACFYLMMRMMSH